MCASCFVGFIESLVEYFNRHVWISGIDNISELTFYRYAYIEIGVRALVSTAQ